MKRNKCIIIAVVALVMICLMVLCACTEAKCYHVASGWIVEKNAKCNEQGLRYIECILCHERLKEESFYGAHDLSMENIIEKEAKCYEPGLLYRECFWCNGRFYEELPPYGKHQWSDENIIDTPPTCTEDGKQHKVCTVCAAIKEENIPKTGHRISDWIIDSEATCEHKGIKHKECISCGITLETYTTVRICHKFSDWIIDSEATCERDGIMHKECQVCHATTEPSKIHYPHEQPPKKVDEKWIIETVCKNCNEIIATKEVETLVITYIYFGQIQYHKWSVKSVDISVSCRGGYGEHSYKYDVYKDGILVDDLCQSWSNDGGFRLSTTNLEDFYQYSVIITVMDELGNTATSEARFATVLLPRSTS